MDDILQARLSHPLDYRVERAGNEICRWWNAINKDKPPGHWEKVEYRQALHDTLEILKRHGVIKDYSMLTGITMYEEDGDND